MHTVEKEGSSSYTELSFVIASRRAFDSLARLPDYDQQVTGIHRRSQGDMRTV